MVTDVEQIHVPSRAKIEALEMEVAKLPQVAIKPVHYLADGLYAREITIPAGTVLTGRVHKQEHINVLSKGEITVWTEDGMRRISAPYTFVSRPGTKRAGYAHAESVWTTIHANPTAETDIQALEALFTEPPSAAILDALKQPCLS